MAIACHSNHRHVDVFASADIRQRLRRCACFLVYALFSITALLLALRWVLIPSLSFLWPHLQPHFYDWAIYGPYPSTSFASFNLSAPRSSTARWDASCESGLVLLDLHGDGAPFIGPYLVDALGNPVWMSDRFGWSANLKVQRFQGEQYLTFWAGEKMPESGRGMYYIMDSSYRVVHTVSAVGEDFLGDLHEFKITEDGTALFTIYDRTHADLSETHLEDKNAHIVDCIVQEVDIATGKLLFEWRASDHISDGAFFYQSSGGVVDDDGSLDYFHINSIEKDHYGNYLLSIRHTHSLLYIDPSGSILWALGGEASDFHDASDPPALDFHWQHDARWQYLDDEYGIITVFDNGIARQHYADAPYSQGRMIHIDFQNRTATLLHTYKSLDHTAASSQGSVQIIPAVDTADSKQHAFVGWGAHAAFSEFTIDGSLLCETHFTPSSFFFLEKVKSYRAIKVFTWVGTPFYDPNAVIQNSRLYVSWNGATEVTHWALQGLPSGLQLDSHSGGDPVEREYQNLDIVSKDDTGAFESSFDLSEFAGEYATFRAVALDAGGNILRYSNAAAEQPWTVTMGFWGLLAFLVTAGVVAGYVVRRYGRVFLVAAFGEAGQKLGGAAAGYARLAGRAPDD